MCGDSTKKEDVELLMDGNKADMVFTDPPYSVNYEKKVKEIFGNNDYNKISNDELSVDEISESVWKPSFRNMHQAASDHCSFYMTAPQGGDQMMMMMMMKENWQMKHELIWIKNNPVFSMGRLDYDYQHEPILYGWNKTHKFYGNGEFTKSIWHIDRTKKNKLHPTMKPIELISNAILNSSLNNDVVLDLFGGSGSTLIACEQLQRQCYMMELDPHYCDVIIQRWETFTDQKARLIT
jgi:DNA modification methylase